MAKSRIAYLKELVDELLEAGVGAHNREDVIDRLLEDGHITTEELATKFGRAGFLRIVIHPVAKQRRADGMDKYMPTKSGGLVQLELGDLDDANATYWRRRHHRDGSTRQLELLRQYIIDRFDVDPEDLPDPTAKDEAEE